VRLGGDDKKYRHAPYMVFFHQLCLDARGWTALGRFGKKLRHRPGGPDCQYTRMPVPGPWLITFRELPVLAKPGGYHFDISIGVSEGDQMLLERCGTGVFEPCRDAILADDPEVHQQTCWAVQTFLLLGVQIDGSAGHMEQCRRGLSGGCAGPTADRQNPLMSARPRFRPSIARRAKQVCEKGAGRCRTVR
jgi:hypothetical protein